MPRRVPTASYLSAVSLRSSQSHRALKSLLAASIVLLTTLTSCIVAFASQPAGYQPNHSYDQGPTDSVDLYGLNPIVHQPLSPTFQIKDSLGLEATAYYSGIAWGTFFNYSTGQPYTVFYRETGSGLMGLGWRFEPGRIWRWERLNTFPNPDCTDIDNVYITSDGAEHSFPRNTATLSDGSMLGDITPAPYIPTTGCFHQQDYTYHHRITRLTSNKDLSTLTFDPNTGALTNRSDYYGNSVSYTYMTPEDFPGAQPAQYNFDNLRYFMGEPNVVEIIRAPKTMTDSMGRTVTFKYGLIDGYSKFLLTGIESPTPNGIGTYKLYYQMRTINSAPPGWPAWGGGSVTAPYLVKVELPPATAGEAPLTYNYDYDISTGELVEIRYPSGGRTKFTWGNIQLRSWTPQPELARGIVGRRIYPQADSTTTYFDWQYGKAIYPSSVEDRDRTIITDPVGNETEHRFGGFYPSFTGLVVSTRYYKGLAPRYVAGASNLSQYVTPYTGRLIRQVTNYYLGYETPSSPIDQLNALKRVERTTFYDDKIDPSAPSVDNPGSWFLPEINMETRDPYHFPYASLSLRAGYARFQVEGFPDQYLSKMTTLFPDWLDTTESGNLVGTSRRIEGRYNDAVPLWAQSHRVITQGSYKSRIDIGGSGAATQFIERADPSLPPGTPIAPRTGDVVTTYSTVSPAPTSPDPRARGDISQVTYAGGDGSDPLSPTYTETISYRYASLASKKHGSFEWFERDADLGQTGVPSASRDSAGVLTQYTYDNLGRPTAATPAMPEVPTYTTYQSATQNYTDSSGASRSHTYAKSSKTSRGTAGQPDYEETVSEFDGLGHLIKLKRLTATATWTQQTRGYDAFGAPTFVSEWHAEGTATPPGTTTSYSDTSDTGDPFRDPFSRPRKIVTADGSTTRVGYFGLNSMVTVGNINGVASATSTTIYYRDYKGRLRIVDAPVGADAIYSYDQLGKLRAVCLVSQVAISTVSSILDADRFAVTNTCDQTRTFVYNAIGNLTSTSQPENGQTQYLEYDAKHQVKLSKDAALTQFKSTYDMAGRVTKQEFKKNGESTFGTLSEVSYENVVDPLQAHGSLALGKPIQVLGYQDGGAASVSRKDLVYNGLNGRIGQETQTLSVWYPEPSPPALPLADPALETTFTYNNLGSLIQFTYPRVPSSSRIPTKLAYVYSHGFLTRLDSNRQGSDPNIMAPAVSAVSYNASGILSSLTLADGVVETIEPDVQSRPGRIKFTRDAVNLWDSGVYQYDGASNIISVGGQTFTYDLIGRLVTGNTASLIAGGPLYQQTYAYDPYGNMMSRTTSPADPGTVGNQVFQVSNITNRLEVLNPGAPPNTNLSYQYTNLGAVRNDGIHAYSWDAAGRMRSMLTVDESQVIANYDYDERNHRFRTTSGDFARQTLFFRGQDGQVLSEFANPSSTSSPRWRKDYIYALGRHIAVVENIEPDIPSGITSCGSSTCGSDTTVTLNWQAVATPDLYGYDVYRWDTSQPENYIKRTPVPVTSPTYTESATQGITYKYKIVSVDDADVESAATAPRRIRVGDPNPPTIPPTMSNGLADCTSVQLSWSASTDVDSDLAGYNLYRKDASSSTWPSAPRNATIPILGLSFTDTGLSPGSTYNYKAEAVDAAGRKSGYTSIRTVTTMSGEQCGGGEARLNKHGYDESWPLAQSPHRFIGTGPEEISYRIRYYHVDHLGTPRIITDGTGTIVAKATFFPFGESVPGFSSGGNSHWFTGHERELLSGHDYMQMRYYPPHAGRFLSPDPFDRPSGNPQALNLYAYVTGNPVTHMDPSGLYEAGGVYFSGVAGKKKPDDGVSPFHFWDWIVVFPDVFDSFTGGGGSNSDGVRRVACRSVDILMSTPWQLSYTGPLYGPAAGSITWKPSSGEIWFAGGAGLNMGFGSATGSFSFGPLLYGDMDALDDIESQWSWSVDAQFGIGAQTNAASAGSIGGPLIGGPPSFSIARTYGVKKYVKQVPSLCN